MSSAQKETSQNSIDWFRKLGHANEAANEADSAVLEHSETMHAASAKSYPHTLPFTNSTSL
jgi:hypothetical protein